MSAESSQDTGRLLDEAGESWRARLSVLLVALQMMLDIFDFFLIGYIVSVIGPAWHLTYGQTSAILFAGGIGAMLGSLMGGEIADRAGRKPVAVSSCFLYALVALMVALVPTGQWGLMTGLRFLVGLGYGGGGIAQITLVSEIVPTRKRAFIGGLIQIPVAVGLLLAPLSASFLLPHLGWRGLAALGIAPLPIALLQGVFSMESIRWQVNTNRHEAARATLQYLLRRPIEPLPASKGAAPRGQRPPWRLRALSAYPRQLTLIVLIFFGSGIATSGIMFWGPSIIVNFLGRTPAEAAKVFIWISTVGLVGRAGFTFLARYVDRRTLGQLMGFGGAGFLAIAAIGHGTFVGGFSVFIAAIICASLFFDGGFAAIQSYPPELFPPSLAATGAGVSQVSSGFAKATSPVIFAAISGANTVITHTSAARSVLPGTLFIASGLLVVGLAFTFLVPSPLRRRLAAGPRVTDI